MASTLLMNPFDALQGKLTKNSSVVYRTRNGKTHAYVLQNPYHGPLAESRKAVINLFSATASRCKQELADPERRAYWEQQYADYLRTHASNPSATTRARAYSTLRTFVFSVLHDRLKAEQQSAEQN